MNATCALSCFQRGSDRAQLSRLSCYLFMIDEEINYCGTLKDTPQNIFQAREISLLACCDTHQHETLLSIQLFSAESLFFLMACDISTHLQFFRPPRGFKSFVTVVICPGRETVIYIFFLTDAARK